MVIVWIGVAAGALAALFLIIKLIKTHPHDAVSLEQRCKKCGDKIRGLKCPRCDRKPSYGV